MKGDRTYSFATNFNLFVPVEADNSNDVESEWQRKYREKQRKALTNSHKLYVELTRRGFGIIPETPALDIFGREMSTSNLSFYQDSELESGISSNISNAITKHFPKNHEPFYYGYDGPVDELNMSEISELLDGVLAEDRFESARHFAEWH